MPQSRTSLFLAFLLCANLLLAGCAGSQPEPTSTSATTTTTSPPAPVYELVVRIVEETANGKPIPEAEVYVVGANSEAGKDPSQLPASLATDENGEVRIRSREPTTLWVQAFGPGQGRGWTREGATVHVGPNVTAEASMVVEGRTLILPLLRSMLEFTVQGSWSTARASPNPPGNATPATVAFAVPLNQDATLAQAYWERLTEAQVVMNWTQAAGYADLVAGIAWGNGTPVLGSDDVQLPGPCNCDESYGGPAPAGDRSTGLHVVAATNRALVGDVTLTFTGTLTFDGRVPEGLAKPACYPMLTC